MTRYLELPLLIIVGLLLTFLLTWPFVTKISSFYGEASDYSLVGWMLWYNQYSTVTGRILDQHSYFNSNQFFPLPFSLAYSEHLFVPSAIFAPIYWLSKNLVFSVNYYAILTFVFTFVSSFYCFKFFVRNKLASLAGAFVFTFNPLTFAQFFGHHLQLMNKFFIPPLFLFAYLYIKNPTWKNSFLFFLFFTLNALSGVYFQIFSLIFVPLFWLPFLMFQLTRQNIKFFISLLQTSLIFLIFLPVLLYFNLPYLKFSSLEGIYRTLAENSYFSARGIDWISSLKTNLLYGKLVQGNDSFNYTEHTLFLNLLPTLLFLIGLFAIRRKIVFFAFGLVLFFSAIFTFGPTTPLYHHLYQLPVILQGVRVPTRFQFIFYLPFALLVAFGVEKLLKLNRKIAAAIFLCILSLLILENISKANFDSISPTLSYIESKEKEKSLLFDLLTKKNTIHFPIYTAGPFKNVRYLNWSTITGENIFNGYSGYFPADWAKIAEQVKKLDKKAIEKLNLLGIDYLIIHKDLIDQENLNAYNNNIAFLLSGIIYKDKEIEVIDLKRFKFQVSICNLRDLRFEIQTTSYPLAQISGTTFQLLSKLTLVNPKNCYLVSKHQDIYSNIELIVGGKKQILPVKLPVLIEPFEKIKIN